MNDYESYLEDQQTSASARNYLALDNSPDDAAEALDLSNDTGVPASAIYGDLDGFKRTHKAALGSQIIGDNRHIAEFINSHPLAADVAHDSLGELDNVSRSIDKLLEGSAFGKWLKDDSIARSFVTAARGVATPPKAFQEKFGDEPVGRTAFQRPNDIEWAISHPAIASLASVPAFAGELMGRTASGILGMGYEGMSSIFGEKLAREVAGMLEYGMMRGDIGVGGAGGGAIGPLRRIEYNAWTREAVQKAADTAGKEALGELDPAKHIETFQQAARALDMIDLYRDAGLEVPSYVHPYIDKAKELEAKEDIRQLDQSFADALKVPLRDRAPDQFADFLRQQLGEREIGIDPEAVLRLYGDKPPVVDDGILGWIPNLGEQLENAKITGQDIVVPLADWLAKADKDVAKELHDDTRVRPSGLTLNDTKIEAEPKEVISEPVTALRGSAGLEPMAMVGDRRLELRKHPPKYQKLRPEGVVNADQFAIHDENGTKVGYLEGTPYDGGKKLYIDVVGGFENKGFGPNSFGPSLTRDLIRQLKNHYPQLEQIGGFRVSGARGKADTARDVWIKVQPGDVADAYDEGVHRRFRSLLSQNWEPVSKNASALFDLEGTGLAADTPLGQVILGELQRLVPGAESDVAWAAKLKDTEGKAGAVRGMFIPNMRQIIVSLTNPVPLGTAYHESIHALYRMGLFTDKEWNSLLAASKEGNWRERFEIDQRWGKIPNAPLDEESIAEAFRIWKTNKNAAGLTPEVRTLFQRMQDFFDGIRKKILDHLGIERDMDWQEIFEKIDKGEIGSREFAEEGGGAEAAMAEEKPPGGLYTRGKDLGITQSHMDRMLNLIEKRNKEDLVAAQRRAEVTQRRRSNKEWKERRTQIRDEVREALSQRPDIASDSFFTKAGLKLHPDYLSEEQRSRLPKDYVQKKNGVNPDDVAGQFGYSTGDALVERMALLAEDRTRAGLSQRDYFNRLVDIETDRRLNREFGDREQTIRDEARDQAVSETQQQLVHEETLAYALKAGQEPQFTREQVKEMVKTAFDQTPVRQLSFEKIMQKMGATGRKIEEAGAKGKWDEAYRLSQVRNHQIHFAALVKGYEKARAQFDKSAKSLAKDRTRASIDQPYLNWIHDILLRTGHRLSRSVQDLQENIGRQGQTNLADFVKEEQTFNSLRQLDVADFLMDPGFRKNVDDMTHWEFDGLRQSVKILEKAGRDEKSVNVGGENWDRAKVMSEMRDQLSSFGYALAKALPDKGKFHLLRATAWGLTNMETLLNRWDRGNPMGLFNRTIIYPLVEAANGKSRTLREISKQLQELDRPGDEKLKKLVDAPFPDPMSPNGLGKWEGFNFGNVLAMLQNAGNASNWNVLARGYGVEPEALFKWLQKNITKEDVERAVKLGDIFKGLIKKSDNLYERLTGATVEKIPLKPVTFNFADGTNLTVPGWYHPLDRDPIRASMYKLDEETGAMVRTGSRSRESAFDDADYFHAITSNGYTKKRTGAIYPVNLDYNMVPTRLRQMAHDIHFREPILNAEKIFANRLFQEDVAKYYGREYAKDLMPYLRHLAGAESIQSENVVKGTAFLEKMRQNIISTYIGFNPFTVLKHGPTAAWFSSNEVGKGAFADAMRQLWTKADRGDIAKFIMDNSEEIQRRERHWQDTLAGQGNELEDLSSLREKIIEKGSWAVAKSDMWSAMPTWWAAYQKYKGEGMDHGMSVTLADRAVRRAHGSTAETNIPPWVRGGGVLNRYLTSVYGFFGTAMQRRIELVHQVNDMYKLGREGEIQEAAKKAGPFLKNFVTYVVWPTIVEEAVRGTVSQDDRNWAKYMLSAGTMGLSSSVLYLRDLAYGLTTGHDPGVGLVSSVFHDAANFVRDVSHGRQALSKEHAGKTVEDFLTIFGEATGKAPKIVGRSAHFLIDEATGQQKAKTPVEWMRGLVHGEAKRKVHH